MCKAVINIKRIYLFSLVAVIVSSVNLSIQGQQLAFPGAEGYGKYASGGRGGRVIEVTSLLDTDKYGNMLPGTLRAALATEGADPITIVFKVSGIINLNAYQIKCHRPNITIAGQSAPGEGICIRKGYFKFSGGELEIYAEDPEVPDSNIARCNTNMVNNYYKPGPATPGSLYFAEPSYESNTGAAKGYGKWYFSGNFMEGTEGGMNDDNWLGISVSDVGSTDSIKSNAEFEVKPVTTHTAQEAYDTVLAHAGAILPRRDSVDMRIVAEVKGYIRILQMTKFFLLAKKVLKGLNCMIFQVI